MLLGKASVNIIPSINIEKDKSNNLLTKILELQKWNNQDKLNDKQREKIAHGIAKIEASELGSRRTRRRKPRQIRKRR